MEIKISVIVPVYNAQEYLQECIESVSMQKNRNIELLLVDDGSTDESGRICDEYASADERIRVVHQKNAGPTAARHCGVKESRGEYITFLDSDDYFAPGLFDELSRIVDECAPDIVLFNGVEFDITGQTKYEEKFAPGVYRNEQLEQIKESIIYNSEGESPISYAVWMKLFRRDLYLYHQQQVPEVLYKGEDLAVSAPAIAESHCIVVTDFCGYYHRNTPNSIMNTFKIADIEQVKLVAAYLEKKMEAFYESRIDLYVLTHCFDFLDRAIVSMDSYREYRKLIRNTFDETLQRHLKRAKCLSKKWNERLVFYLMKYQLYKVIWVLRHIKKRNGA